MSTTVGFGGQAWGGDPWGGIGGPMTPLTLLGAVAVVENVVRLQFGTPPYFSGLLESDDASDPSHYQIAPVAGTFGLDGTAARPVGVLFAQVGEDPGSIDLFLDRPLTAAPSQYVVTVRGLSDGARVEMVPDPQSAQFVGIYRQIVPPQRDVAAAPNRDFANPQTQAALLDPLPVTSNPLALGTFNVDETGDYAFDHGLTGLKKRIIRRLLTRKGGFAWAPLYGVGIPQHVKQLGSPAVRSRLAADARAQVLQEPEVVACSVTTRTSPTNPGLVFFVVQVQTASGQSTRFAVPFQIA